MKEEEEAGEEEGEVIAVEVHPGRSCCSVTGEGRGKSGPQAPVPLPRRSTLRSCRAAARRVRQPRADTHGRRGKSSNAGGARAVAHKHRCHLALGAPVIVSPKLSALPLVWGVGRRAEGGGWRVEGAATTAMTTLSSTMPVAIEKVVKKIKTPCARDA